MNSSSTTQSKTENNSKDKMVKKRKTSRAFAIGLLVGIFFMGAAASVKSPSAARIVTMIIPLFLIYKLVKNSKKK